MNAADLFNDCALERLVASNQDYYSTHGHYLPPLAQLLLEARFLLDQQKVETKEARDAFIRYGRHLSWCAKQAGGLSCDCGYVDSLGVEATREFEAARAHPTAPTERNGGAT